jgi:hypothetical protein
MSTLAVRPETCSDIPDLEALKPLGQMLRRVGLSLQAGHRWRMHPKTPLQCWKVGHSWMTTEEALRDFIRRRTGQPSPPPSPVETLTPERRRQVEQSISEARQMMRSR